MGLFNSNSIPPSELAGIIKHAVEESLLKDASSSGGWLSGFEEVLNDAVKATEFGNENNNDESETDISSFVNSIGGNIEEGNTIEDSFSSALVDIGLSGSFASNLSSEFAESLDEAGISEEDILENLDESTGEGFAPPPPDDLSQEPDNTLTANPEESPAKEELSATGDESDADADLASFEQEQKELEEQEQQEQQEDDTLAEVDDDDDSSIT